MLNKIRRSGAKIMASLIALLGSLSWIMLFAVINGSLGQLLALGVVLFGSIGVAKAIGGIILMPYWAIILCAVMCGVLRGALRYIEQYSNHFIAFKLLATLRDKIFGALRVLCPAKLETKKKGSIIAMITADTETLEVFYAHTISPICIAIIVSTSVILFVGIYANWILALCTLCAYFVIGIFVPLIASKTLKESGVKYRTEFASFNSYFLDSIKGIKDIVLNNAGKERINEVNRRSDILLKETKNLKHESAKASAFTELSVSMSILITLLVGVLLVVNGTLEVYKMIIAIVCIFGSFGPVIAIAALPSNLTNTFASGDRVLDLLSEEPVVKDIENKEDIDFESLDVKNLSFAYEQNEKVLEDITFNAKKGEIVGIVGESGCGKSTILKLLLRFWAKESGEIDYNGIDIENINSQSLHKNVTMVSQSTYLFNETIKENLLIAKQDATDEEIINACKAASIHSFISSLPQQYDTLINTMTENISAGEKQRIGLARAFLSGSEMILLDEPTSNVDSINEGIILKALKDIKGQKSIILVSHRESTMAIADRVYKVENGQMKEI
ncbi:MAG: ABC transporter ATP-binding protein/permease [Clostridia bacterium]|nr:ABC transporter ATP-binding protein/permease [Clostridia bacterium]